MARYVIEPIPSTSPATITCSCCTCARARAHACAHALWHLPHDLDDPEQPQQLEHRVGRAGDVAADDDAEVEDVPQVVEVPVACEPAPRACVRASACVHARWKLPPRYEAHRHDLEHSLGCEYVQHHVVQVVQVLRGIPVGRHAHEHRRKQDYLRARARALTRERVRAWWRGGLTTVMKF